MPTLNQKTIKTYDTIAKGFSDSHFDPNFWKKEFEIFQKLISGKPPHKGAPVGGISPPHQDFLCGGKKIIDIGCGAGRDAILFKKAKFDYTGIDASSKMLKEARKRVPRGKPPHQKFWCGGTFIVMDFYNLTFPPGTFDGFWASASLLHIPKNKIKKVLQDIAHIIKTDGIGFISLKEKREMDHGIIQENKYGSHIERFFAFYTDTESQKVLRESGFDVIKNHTLKKDDTNWICYFVKKHG